MYYAVRSVGNVEVNKIYEDWNQCKELVWGKTAVYKSFPDASEAEIFLKNAPVKNEEYGHGYVPVNIETKLIIGRYKFDRCKEKENGFSVRVYEGEKKEKFTCRGFYLPDNDRIQYAFTGRFVKDQKYGYEFFVDSYTEHVTDEKDSIIGYLSSGIISGIGKKRAEDIYAHYGANTLEIMEKTPEKLLSIKGISQKVLDKIKKSFEENRGARELVSYLLKYGISPKVAMKLYATYGTCALSKVKKNPYILCQIRGLTFLDADRVAQHEGVAADADIRFRACALYVLKYNETAGECRGSTGMELQAFGNAVLQALGPEKVTKTFVNKKTSEMLREGKLRGHREGEYYYIYSEYAFKREYELAKFMIQIRDSEVTCKENVDLENLLSDIERKFNVTYDEIQKKAVITVMRNNLTIITGGPGTGKTTDIRAIDACYGQLFPYNRRIYLAPTGRAARKIAEATGEEAFTAQSFLRIFEDMPAPEEDIIIENALVVVDEFSMMDVDVAHALFKAMKKNCKIVIVGDINQLPSVGPGAVLRDIIESGVLPVIWLEKIYRQNENDEIYLNAKKITNRDTNILDGNDFHFIECRSMEDIKNSMAHKYVEYVNTYGIMNVMCLCPYIDHTAGVAEMNQVLQDLINPLKPNMSHVEVAGFDYRPGDLVMHHKRNTPEAANGDIGIILDIIWEDDDYYTIIVNINDREIEYTRENIDTLSLAYAMSVHKSQGSEADAVITCLSSFHRGMLFMNIPNVAVSRGKKDVTFFGERAALNEAIMNREGKRRITILGYFLAYFGGKFVSVC